MKMQIREAVWKSAIVTVVLLTAFAGVATAADIEPSSLSVSQARGFLGEWVLTVDIEGGETMHLLLNFTNIDGKLAATLQSPQQTEPQIVTDITESSLALKLRYAAQFGETETGMSMIVRLLEGGTLTGSMSDEMVEAGEDDHGAIGLGLFAARLRGVKGGKLPGRAIANFDGNLMKVSFGSLRAGSPDHKALASLKDGEVFEFGSARATKMFTDASLTFGDVVIESENAGPNYPGVYSLWLKKVGDGWSLVFNEEADIWGSMHNPEADVAEIPLTLGKCDSEQKLFDINLEERGKEGVLRVAWGSQAWSADFSLAQ